MVNQHIYHAQKVSTIQTMFDYFFVNEKSNTLLNFYSFTGYEELIAGFILNDFIDKLVCVKWWKSLRWQLLILPDQLIRDNAQKTATSGAFWHLVKFKIIPKNLATNGAS
jgi:hypothetical protein